MKFIIGQKVAMTQLWQGDKVIPVTKLVAGPCTVLQIKTLAKDGYQAVQLGYGKRRASLITKALQGHFKGFGDFRFVKEFRFDEQSALGELKPGDQISVITFTQGDKLTVVGTSKGKGFQGVVKRHGFHGQDATHGNKDQLRASGSVGSGGVQHVFKGTRMSGRMGNDRVTLHDIEIIEVDEKNNTMFVKGPVPGARHGLVILFGEGELKLGLPKEEIKEEPKIEEVKTEEVEEGAKIEEPVLESKEDKVAVVADIKTEEVKEETTAEVTPTAQVPEVENKSEEVKIKEVAKEVEVNNQV
jgi:large subunit ribosomal protein L3